MIPEAVVTGLGLGYLLGLATLPRVLLQRRESTATLAWVLGIVLIPYLGILSYWLFGSRRIRRVKRTNLAQAVRTEPARLKPCATSDRCLRYAEAVGARHGEGDWAQRLPGALEFLLR